MKEYLDIVYKFLTSLTIIFGFIFAFYRFILKRESQAFLNLRVDTKVVAELNGMILVSVMVQLENRGETRITARRVRDPKGYLYSDGYDQCPHAGTLKIRPVEQVQQPLLIDWYSLKPFPMTISQNSSEDKIAIEDDLEQINYLDEYQDYETDYKEVEFWIEPHESAEIQVPVWLQPGIYAAKAIFLGKKTQYMEEEYWSHTVVFCLKPCGA